MTDAQLAEELAIRYADTEHARRWRTDRSVAALFVGGMLLFWLVAALYRDHAANSRDRGLQLR